MLTPLLRGPPFRRFCYRKTVATFPGSALESYKFYACERKEGESIASFVVDLQKASDFGDQLDDMHLGCLVIARSYEVLDLAMSMEQATAGSKDIHRISVSTTGLGEREVHKIRSHVNTMPEKELSADGTSCQV